mmetsp:Transcript_18174/g.45167  ORF Transcript_18174/g.45167 Transcript_18174/m.45167 type:complete len:194 (+) Transcript_18174:91-672(+)
MNPTPTECTSSPRVVSPTSTMDIFECITPPSIPISISISMNDGDREKGPSKRQTPLQREEKSLKKRRKPLRRKDTLYHLHDPSSVVQKVRLDHRWSTFGQENVITRGTMTSQRKPNNAVSGDDLAVKWTETWKAFRQATAAAAQRNTNIITVADALSDESSSNKNRHSEKVAPISVFETHSKNFHHSAADDAI